MALTFKQEKFAQHYAEYRDGPRAYRHAYNVGAMTKKNACETSASKLLALPQIKERIDAIVSAGTPALAMTVDKLRTMFVEIATADPDELTGLRVGNCRHCWGTDHAYQWREREYLALCDEAQRQDAALPDIGGGFGFRAAREPNPECPECDGEGIERVVARDTSKLTAGARALFGGVKRTRHGPELIIADRHKALETLGRILGAYDDKVRHSVDMNAAVQSVKLQTTDPHEAERIYREMVQSIAVK